MKTTGKGLLIRAAKNELTRLSAKVVKARKEVDEHMEAPGVMLALYEELQEIMFAGKYDKASMQKVDDLDRRHKAAVKASKKDLIKLLDKQFDAEQMYNDLATEIGYLEFSLNRHKAKNEAV